MREFVISTVISSAANTAASAYATLKQMGYVVSVSEDGKFWRGQRADCSLVAEDPLTMLGLAKLYELRPKNWRPSDAEVDEFVQFCLTAKLD